MAFFGSLPVARATSVQRGACSVQGSLGLLAARCLLLALVVAALLAVPASADPIFDSGHAFFAGLLRAASFGMTDLERAAFIVRDGDGSLRCEAWPATGGKHAESFRGAMPPGTVAIVHTHPIEWPLPSPHDIEEASRLRVPIYVLTMRNVYRASPESPWPDAVVRGKLWFKDAGTPIRCADLQ